MTATVAAPPEVTIVVPAYNAARFLGRTLDSVLRQSFQDWELVVVDDGSTDSTAVLAEGFSSADARIRLVRQANAGVATARNHGLKNASDSCWAVLFLDADDVLEADALNLLVTALRAADRNVLAAHGLIRHIDADDRPVRPGEGEAFGRERFALVGGRIVPWPKERHTTLAALILSNYISTPGAILLRRVDVEALGGFDPDPAIAIAEDWDLWLRLACRGDFVLVDTVVLAYRVHRTSLSSDARAMDRARWYVHEKLLHRAELSEQQRQLVYDARRAARFLSSRNWARWAWHSLAAGKILTATNQARHALLDLVYAWGG